MNQLSKRGVVLAALACAALLSCVGLKDGYFAKDGVRYRVLVPDPARWQQESFANNDLAWVNRDSGHVLSVNATCGDHGDPGLEVLTNHLLFGFTERTLKSRQLKQFDGRDALLSSYVATLDGVSVEIELAVLKKNDCVHDFIYISPVGRSQEHRAEFDRLLLEFTAEKT